ncbi:MAG: hypothetical protein RLZZ612_19 [Pseudomonadota bacterium]|jgi:adenylate cyclase
MPSIHKPTLIDSLLQLMQSTAHADQTTDVTELRRRIGKAIDEAIFPRQQTDTRRVTILLSDLRGFTSLSEKYSAMEMVGALNRYLERMSDIILSHGGTIDKFMGDAIMALFGAPAFRSDDLEAALSCAIEMQAAMQDINAENELYGMAPLYMGIGINTGEVVAGHLGSSLHNEYTVIGDQVNLVSRIEAHTLRGQILLSENAYQLACDIVEIGDINEVRVKGKKGMVRMYELLGVLRPEPKKAPTREIRNSPRVEVDLPIRFQRLIDKTVEPQAHVARVVDMSYGGMFILSPVELQTLSDIKISVSMSLLEPDLTEIYAKVLRVTPVHGEFECRIEFTSIDANATQSVKEFVNSIVEMKRH